MTTVTARMSDVMAIQKGQGHFAQSTSRAISPGQRTKREVIQQRGHEEWERGIEEAWQGHIETLQQYLCDLLVKNQQLRMALMAANEPKRGHRDAGHL